MVDHIKPDVAIYSATVIDVRCGSPAATTRLDRDVRFSSESGLVNRRPARPLRAINGHSYKASDL
jgi:hypothetical protein